MIEEKNLFCLDSKPNFLGIFDLSIAPPFLYYSYIPIILLMLFMGNIIYRKNKTQLQNQLFFGFSIAYSLYLLNEIFLWVATPVNVVFFGWQMVTLLNFIFSLLFFMFAISFIEKKDFSFLQKKILLLLSLPVFIFLPTKYNISYFDYELCEGTTSFLRYYIYFIDFYFLAIISYLGFTRFKQTKDKSLVFFTTGSVLMLVILMMVNMIGDQTLLYEIDVIGPLGILIFTGFLCFMIVRYKTFKLELLGPQALVLILGFLTFSALFIRKINNIKIILVFNLIAITLIGYLLIKSVKKIDIQREQLEKANQNQQSLLHFITHQVKGYLTKSRNIFAGMVTKDYGELPTKAEEMAKYGFDSDTRGVETVMSILRASDLKTGKTEFRKERINISSLVAEVIDFRKDIASQKGIDITFEIEPNIETQVDPIQIKEVFKNLLTNAILYTPQGTVKVVLRREFGKIKFSVIDTGVGLSLKDKEKLFTEGGKGEESSSVNVDSTGYGLFVAKEIVLKHQGKIGAISEGRNKGSEFFVILPDIQ